MWGSFSDYSDPSESDALPERLGTVLCRKWRVDQLVGVGGMAHVYAATHRNRSRVALKILRAELAADEEVNARFLREGYLANSVDHPGAVSVFDDDITGDGCAVLVMELLSGETLDVRAERLGGKILDVEEVLTTAYEVLDVLAAAHEKGIVHRDIKPDNLFRRDDGVIKVLDFGIAGLWDVAREPKSGVTQKNVVMGTPGFMASEQALGRWDEVDERTDLWAVGATMFFLLTGQPVRKASTARETLILAVTEPVPSVATLAPELPSSVVALIDRALSYRKEDRWSSASEMQCAVTDALHGLGARPSMLPRPAFPRNPCRSEFPCIGRRSKQSPASGLPCEPRSAFAKSQRRRPTSNTRVRPFAIGLALLGVAAVTTGFVVRASHEGAPASPGLSGMATAMMSFATSDGKAKANGPRVEVVGAVLADDLPLADAGGGNAHLSPPSRNTKLARRNKSTSTQASPQRTSQPKTTPPHEPLDDPFANRR